jgi:hypothetical protein
MSQDRRSERTGDETPGSESPNHDANSDKLEAYRAVFSAVEKEIKDILKQQDDSRKKNIEIKNPLPENTFAFLKCGNNSDLGKVLYDWYVSKVESNTLREKDDQETGLALIIGKRVENYLPLSRAESLASTLLPVIAKTVQEQKKISLKILAIERMNKYLEQKAPQQSNNNNNDSATTNTQKQILLRTRKDCSGLLCLKSTEIVVLATHSTLVEFDKRFIDSHVGLYDSALLVDTRTVADDDREQPTFGQRDLMSHHLTEERRFAVHVLSSGSGTGKSNAALLMSRFGVALYLTGGDLNESDLEKLEAFCVDPTKQADPNFVVQRNAKVTEIITSGIKKLVGDNPRFDSDTNTRVCLIIDEIGKYPNFLRGLCGVWGDLRGSIKNTLKIAETKFYAIAVGTGAENFEVSTIGSLPSTYALFVMRSTKHDSEPLVFRELLSALVKAGNLVAKGVQALLFESPQATPESWQPIITDEVTLRFHELIRNPRCAAIACRLIFKHFETYEGSILDLKGSDAMAPSIRQWLPLWSLHIVHKFANNNGLEKYYVSKQAAHVIGKAIAIVRDHVPALDKPLWNQLGVECGLLTDSACKIDKTTFDREPKRYTVVPIDPIERDKVLVHLSDRPRFRLSDPAVAIFLLMSTPTIVGAAMANQATNTDWSLFEILVADYLMVCGLSPTLRQVDHEGVKWTTATANATTNAGSSSAAVLVDAASTTNNNNNSIANNHNVNENNNSESKNNNTNQKARGNSVEDEAMFEQGVNNNNNDDNNNSKKQEESENISSVDEDNSSAQHDSNNASTNSTAANRDVNENNNNENNNTNQKATVLSVGEGEAKSQQGAKNNNNKKQQAAESSVTEDNANSQFKIDDHMYFDRLAGYRFDRPKDIFKFSHEHQKVHRCSLTFQLHSASVTDTEEQEETTTTTNAAATDQDTQLTSSTNNDDQNDQQQPTTTAVAAKKKEAAAAAAAVAKTLEQQQKSRERKLKELDEFEKQLHAAYPNIENDLIVLVNGDKAKFADVIAFSKNQIFLIQCKYYVDRNKLDSNAVTKEFKKMEDLEILVRLARCSRGGRGPDHDEDGEKTTDITVVSVVLALNEASFTNSVLTDEVLKQQKSLSDGFTFNLTRRVCYVIPSNSADKNNNSYHSNYAGGLYPVMQLPIHPPQQKHGPMIVGNCSGSKIPQGPITLTKL